MRWMLDVGTDGTCFQPPVEGGLETRRTWQQVPVRLRGIKTCTLEHFLHFAELCGCDTVTKIKTDTLTTFSHHVLAALELEHLLCL